jgi:predicted metal-dependent phosphoesterase TrpH
MRIDYHCHTTASDGSLEPQALIGLALERGIESLAITDHDTVAAYGELTVPAGLNLVTGTELSTTWRKNGIHIVGLNIDLASDATTEAMAFMHDARTHRASKIAERLERYGLENPLAGAQAFAGDGTLGRPHFARYLVATGFVKDEGEAFKKYLGSGKPCDIKHTWPEPQQVVEWIREAGGTAVLAHPAKYKFTRTKLTNLIQDFVSWGGEALEVVSGQQIPSLTRDLASLARQFNLWASWGSDFHHPGQTWAALGLTATPPQDLKPIWQRWH